MQKAASLPTIVDVRNREEVEAEGRIEGAVNYPWGVVEKQPELFSAILSDLPPGTVVFHCKSGRRSKKAQELAEQLGCHSRHTLLDLEGGFQQWKEDGFPVNPFNNNHSPWVHTIFDKDTETAQYVVTDIETKEAYIIDPVLDYDPFSATVRPKTANHILNFVKQHGLNVTKIIDTHVHADHLTAALYLKRHLDTKPEFCIGTDVTKVQAVFGKMYNIADDNMQPTGEQFDRLVKDGDQWKLGQNIMCSVISTPGHTPACLSYRIGDSAFVGDTLFMPDIGTARCDFPGGSSELMYESVHKMYRLWPDDTRVFVGHDYPPEGSGRSYEVMAFLGTHKKSNKMIKEGVTLEQYTKLRKERDEKLRAPRYIHQSLQTNLRGGHLPEQEKSALTDNETAGSFFKLPVRWK
ncbi:hypothetical protein EC973_002732 [Apophysomyces ossiformis]|uniref:Rhodanese domain-containing protein n=1 Tax=Apophysomyces ossiformis TaxID=679940 RepID=A0A8H7BS36_9FUNG|nr:hypothetical protein EC973_002732 [Apophysomyces ossiformis]